MNAPEHLAARKAGDEQVEVRQASACYYLRSVQRPPSQYILLCVAQVLVSGW